ncbi:EAL domain-containing protein [Saccharothrix variisporea]|uniref:EAL domain-containing protein (Putative c-di-GMP-specific phosphodiesterase class I) n=1 Tax=Saccharothrix variisporea TaxID=543527 RepID=A0A495X061_9PSEU|nr:EAL domain-containing protein [Saccharothrix variisporea]RKT67049.1 EAL domain-containing protein (putative c-di-GMP-specific phosphodiesterase class I) [Saccharothrix variisporea]
MRLTEAHIAAARLRLAVDARLGTPTPDAVRRIAAMTPDGPDADVVRLPSRGEVAYQPRVAVGSGRVVGVELLPAGPTAPEELIAVAARQVRRWLDRGVRLPVRVSVPLSLDEGFAGRVAAVLRQHDVPPGLLLLGFDESQLVDGGEAVESALARLSAVGVALAVDGFGTCYSPISALRPFRFGEVRIDTSFAAAEDASSLAVLRAMVDLGRGLEVAVATAEVDSVELLDRLTELGIGIVQGDAVAPAMSDTELDEWLTDRADVATS